MGGDYYLTVFRGVRTRVEYIQDQKRYCSHPDFSSNFCPECGVKKFYTSSRMKGEEFFEETEEDETLYRSKWEFLDVKDDLFVGCRIETRESRDCDYSVLDLDAESTVDLDEIQKQLELDGFKVEERGVFLITHAH